MTRLYKYTYILYIYIHTYIYIYTHIHICIFSKHQWWAPLSLQVWQAATQAGAAQAPALSGELSAKRIDLILDYQAPASTCNYRYKQVICHNLSAISHGLNSLRGHSPMAHFSASEGFFHDVLLRLWGSIGRRRQDRSWSSRQRQDMADHPSPRPPCWSYYSSYDLCLLQHSLQAVDSVGMVSYDCFSRQ